MRYLFGGSDDKHHDEPDYPENNGYRVFLEECARPCDNCGYGEDYPADDIHILLFIGYIPEVQDILRERENVAEQRNTHIEHKHIEDKERHGIVGSDAHVAQVKEARDKERHASDEIHKARACRHKIRGEALLCESVLHMAASLVYPQIAGHLDGQAENAAGELLPKALDICAGEREDLADNIELCHHIRSHSPFVRTSSRVLSPLIICKTLSEISDSENEESISSI